MKQVLSFSNLNSFATAKKDRKGQAVVEYLLILVITLTILGAVKNIFIAVDEFMYSYMGEYVSCLMEYGELPEFGVEESDLKKHVGGSGKKCVDGFAQFSLTAGKPASGGGGGSGGSGSGSGSSGSTNRNSSSNKNPNRTDRDGNSSRNASSNSNDGTVGKTTKKSNSGDSSDSNGSRFSDSSDPKKRYAKGAVARNDGSGLRTNDGGSGDDDRVKITDPDEEEARRKRMNGGGSSRTYSGNRERYRYRAITGTMAQEIEKRERSNKIFPTTRTLAKANDKEGMEFGPRRSTYNPPVFKPPAQTEDNGGLNFGNWIKWLIIIAMGIAIFLFFGSQVMGFLNSQDK